jgi:hypothetical protein
MTKACYRMLAFFGAAFLLVPNVLLAAAEKADMLIHVADSRRVTWSVSRYFLDVYNTNPFMFGVWCVIIVLILGGGLGLLTDFCMKRTGIDLTSRKIVEH